MKKMAVLLLLLCVTLFMITGCKNDQESEETLDTNNINGTKIETNDETGTVEETESIISEPFTIKEDETREWSKSH